MAYRYRLRDPTSSGTIHMPDDVKIETWIKHETKIQYTKQYPKDPFVCPQKGRTPRSNPVRTGWDQTINPCMLCLAFMP